jgi:23S rRNA (adenine-N6)-dimethyltransferase
VTGRRARGARPGRAASQHFLRSSALAAELVRDAGVGPGDLVLDLGAGTGRLTAELARRAGAVVAVELEPRLAAGLRDRWPNVDVIEGDATLVPLPSGAFRVVANVPFHRTTEIMRRLLDDPRTPLLRADLVVEWGVALKRASPWPSTLNGVLWGAWYGMTLARRLPASAFDPPPSVDAGVLVVERRTVPLVDERAWRDFRAFAAAGFRHGLHAIVPRRALRRLEARTGRELDAHQWAELFRTSRPQTEAWAASRRRPRRNASGGAAA